MEDQSEIIALVRKYQKARSASVRNSLFSEIEKLILFVIQNIAYRKNYYLFDADDCEQIGRIELWHSIKHFPQDQDNFTGYFGIRMKRRLIDSARKVSGRNGKKDKFKPILNAMSLSKNLSRYDDSFNTGSLSLGDVIPAPKDSDPFYVLSEREAREVAFADIVKKFDLDRTPQRKRIFELTYIDCLNNEEIAEVMGITQNTIHSHRHHLKNDLAKKFGVVFPKIPFNKPQKSCGRSLEYYQENRELIRKKARAKLKEKKESEVSD